MAIRTSSAWIGLALTMAVSPTPAATQDVAAGQRIFGQCRACHTVEQGGRSGVGPNLYGVIGRRAGLVEGFRYSAPMRERAAGGLTWSEETLRAYLRDPKSVVPGGSMAFVGLRNDQQLADMIAYLRQVTGAAQ